MRLKYKTLEEIDNQWRKKRAIELKAQDVDDYAIAERLGMTLSQVQGITQRRPPHWTKEEFDKARDLKKRGWSASKISRVIQRSRCAIIGKLLRENKGQRFEDGGPAT